MKNRLNNILKSCFVFVVILSSTFIFSGCNIFQIMTQDAIGDDSGNSGASSSGDNFLTEDEDSQYFNNISGYKTTYTLNDNQELLDAQKDYFNLLGKDIFERLYYLYENKTNGNIEFNKTISENLELDTILTYDVSMESEFSNIISTAMNVENNEEPWLLGEANYNDFMSNRFIFQLYVIGEISNMTDDQTFISDINSLKTSTEEERELNYNNLVEKYLNKLDYIGLLNEDFDNLSNYIDKYIIGVNAINADNQKFTDFDGDGKYTAELYYLNDNATEVLFDSSNFTNFTDLDIQEDYNIMHNDIVDESNEDLSNRKTDPANGWFDAWSKQTFINNGYCTEETYDHSNYYYHISYCGSVKYIEFYAATSSSDNEEVNANGEVKYSEWYDTDTQTYSEGYPQFETTKYAYDNPGVKVYIDEVFDHCDCDFKNYSATTENIVDQMKQAYYVDNGGENIVTYDKVYTLISGIMVKDSIFSESNTDDDYSDSIISNVDADYSLNSVLLMLDKDSPLPDMSLTIEFNPDSNDSIYSNISDYSNVDGIKLHILVNYKFIASSEDETDDEGIIDMGSYQINKGAYDIMGTQIDPMLEFRSKLALENKEFINNTPTNGESLLVKDLTPEQQDCFGVIKDENGNILNKYSDINASYVEIIFIADKINGVTPSYTLDFSMPAI